MQENSLLTGNIRSGLLKYSIPIILSMLTTQLYAIVDTMIIGIKLDSTALAAASNASTVLMIFLFISGGLELGANLLMGAKKPISTDEELSAITYNIVVVDVVVAVILMALGWVLFPSLLTLINTPEEIMALAVTYGRVYLLGLPFLMFYDVAKQILMGVGNSKTPMYWVLITSFINVVLDIVFIEYWGVGGAAAATALAQVVGAVAFVLLLKKHLFVQPFSVRVLSKDYIKNIFRLSVPNMLQQMTGPIAYNVRQSLLGNIGVAAIAGFSCANKITSLILMGTGGFCQGLVIFLAQNYAAKQDNRVREGIRSMTKILIVFVLVMVMVCFFGNRMLLSLFTSDDQAIAYGALMLMYEPASLLIAIVARIQESKLRGRQKMLAYTCSSISTTGVNVLSAVILVPWIGFAGFYIAAYIGHIYSAVMSTALARKYAK